MDMPRTENPIPPVRPVNKWLRLFRLPNLLTVPGDPMAGFLLASAGSEIDRAMLIPMLAAMGAALCLYLFGLALNDIVDLETDRVERPDRPLPSGQITVPQAKMAAIAAALSGLNIALIAGRSTLCVAGTLAVMILVYNLVKRIPVFGVGIMGACRALSFGLGVVAAIPEKSRVEGFIRVRVESDTPTTIAQIGLLAYIIAFSVIARNEMRPEKPTGFARWLPFCVLLLMLPSVIMTTEKEANAMPLVCVFLMCMAIMWAWRLGGALYHAQPVPDTVAGHIRNLMLVQACLCTAAGSAGLFPAFFLMALWALFPRLARQFYSS
ncbi:MAG: UbiA family prenyltransferase [Kiritimatiellaeota bacterium]|nr:UbiA family prenyltransferase [Kiritimatiellota bacterium]